MTIGCAFAKLADVRPFKTTWKVRVKVIHSWRQYSGMSGETMDLVLADEHGTKMHAGIKKKDIGRLSKLLVVGEWKVLENFQVSPATGLFRPTPSNWKIGLSMNTIVTTCSIKVDDMFLSLVPIQTILDGDLNHNFLIDVIGQVLDVSEIKTVPVLGREKRKLECVLRDINDQRINCCLWAGYADQLYEACSDMQVTNAFDASKLIINPICEEADAFRIGLPDDGAIVVIQEDDEEAEKQRIKEQEDAWLALEMKSVYDIQNATEIEKFRISVKVTGIDTDWGWYYFGCGKCQFRVTKDLKKEGATKPRPKAPVWYCDRCKSNVKTVEAKFKLHLLVEDDSAKTKVMLLDSVAYGIVDKTASFLLNGSYDEIQDPELIPDDVKSLVGKSFEFLVGVEKEHIVYGNDTYKVHKVKKGLLILDTESGDGPFIAIDNGSTIASGEELSVVKSNSQSISDDGSTPSPKRDFESMHGVPAGSSTSKKHCPKQLPTEASRELVNPDGLISQHPEANKSEAKLHQLTEN
ncbi:unnamed protein product [Microthlaspi erraticum]|uniref:Replication protein A 70 kDa DNA-binding subunit B/D first OB fold domain-containing protein n=1 Tax=Microthlaspi erraticum TaxID=1685480 RepID=A0A6D2L862_9BRAS|nr:unnamed protein product [Microthlaspi erraticum]